MKYKQEMHSQLLARASTEQYRQYINLKICLSSSFNQKILYLYCEALSIIFRYHDLKG